MSTQKFGRIIWEPHALFGAKVDVDLSQSLEPDEEKKLQELLFEHGLLEFSGQKLDMDQQMKVSGYFGPVLPKEEGFPYISPKGALGAQELAFHRDLAELPKPFTALTLYGVEVEPGQTSTRFSSGIVAYETLPDALKQRIAGKQAVFAFPNRSIARFDLSILDKDLNLPKDYPQGVHPVVFPHPKTGKPILYPDTNFTVRILHLPLDESEALIGELLAHHHKSDNIVEHRWYNGDFVIWDNMAMQHARGDLGDVAVRTLGRTMIGEQTFAMVFPDFRPLHGDQYRPARRATA